MSLEPEAAIMAAFPGDTGPHRTARLALLRLYHAGERCRWSIEDMDTRIAELIDDPVEGIFDGLLIDDANTFASRLESLAAECRKASKALQAIRNEWRHFDTEGKRDQHGRLAANPRSGSEEEPPF